MKSNAFVNHLEKENINTKEILYAGLFLLLCICLFFAEPIVFGKTISPVGNIFEQPFYKPNAPKGFIGYPNYLLYDQSSQLYPMQNFAMNSIRNRQIPLWNPNIMLGTSVLGSTQTALFYPFNLLALFFSTPTVILIRCILNLWVAGFFTFLFVRKLGVKFFGAILSAISFMFCGFLIVWLGHPHSNSAVWLPALFLFGELLISSNSRKALYSCFCAIFICLSFLGGHMETTFSVVLSWCIYVVCRSYFLKGFKFASLKISNLFLIILLGVLLSAIQLLPFLEWLINYAAFSDRSHFSFQFINFQFWKDLLTLPVLVLPNLFSNPSQISLYQSYLPWTNFNEFSMYVGIIPFVLGLLGLFKLRSFKIRFFIFGSLFFLGLSIKFPFVDLINNLPILSMFKVSRYRLIFDFGLAVSAGIIIDELFSKSEYLSNWKVLKMWSLYSGLFLLLLILSISIILPLFEDEILLLGKKLISEEYAKIQVHSRSLNEVLLLVRKVWDGLIFHFSLFNWRLYFPGVILFSFGILISFYINNKIEESLFKVIIILFLLVDLFVFGIGYNPSIKYSDIYPNTAAVNFLKSDSSVFRILPATMQWRSNGPLAHNLNEIGGCELPTKYYHNFRNIIASNYSFSTNEYSTGFVAKDSDSKLVDLLNVKYVITSKNLDTSLRDHIKLIWKDGDVRIYKNSSFMNRVFFVNKARVLSDEASLIFMKSSQFKPDEEVVLSNSYLNNQFTADSGSNKIASIKLVSYGNEFLDAVVTTSDKGYLVLSDSYYPGWVAYVDGVKTPILRANYVMRAISLSKGIHNVKFNYEPYSFYLGGFLSFLAFILVVFLIVNSYFTKTR